MQKMERGRRGDFKESGNVSRNYFHLDDIISLLPTRATPVRTQGYKLQLTVSLSGLSNKLRLPHCDTWLPS